MKKVFSILAVAALSLSIVACGGEEKKDDKKLNWSNNKLDKPVTIQHFEGVTHIAKRIHNSWITKVKYIKEVNSIVSCSLDRYVHFHDLHDLKYHNNSFSQHTKGVSSFVYSHQFRFIASCGEERYIIVWEPFNIKLNGKLHGHNTSIQDLTINEEKNHLISLSTDKCVKVWDTSTLNCIQTISDKIS